MKDAYQVLESNLEQLDNISHNNDLNILLNPTLTFQNL